MAFWTSMKFRAPPPDQHYGFKSLCKFKVLEVPVQPVRHPGMSPLRILVVKIYKPFLSSDPCR